MGEHRAAGDVEAAPTQDGPGAVTAGSAGSVTVGSVVAGVRLTAWLGAGSNGSAWAGTDVDTGERVAVKLLHDDVVDSRGRWLQEAELLQRVDLPHLLALRRVALDPPALVTELAVGGSLAAQVRARGPLSAGEAVTVLVPLAETLAGLHRQHVVHGDVSGGNVLFVDLGRPVLADLGAAATGRRGGRRAARAAAGPAGTPGYVAPEVLDGARAREPADVHGLGAVAWLALTGATPPAAGDRLPLRLLAPECPDPLVEVVQDALSVDPARRPTAAEVARRVRVAAPALPVHLVPSAARGLPPDEALTYRVEGWAGVARISSTGRLGRLRRAAVALAPRLPGRPVRPRSGAGGRRVVVLTAAALLLLAGSAGVLAGVLPGPGGGLSTPATVGAPARTPDLAPNLAPDPAPDAGAGVPGAGAVPPLHERVVDVVQRREQALRSGDPAAIGAVHASGARARAPDALALGDGPLDVRFEVTSVVPVAGADHVADVDVLTRWAEGESVRERVRVSLVAEDGRWVLQDVRRAPAG